MKLETPQNFVQKLRVNPSASQKFGLILLLCFAQLLLSAFAPTTRQGDVLSLLVLVVLVPIVVRLAGASRKLVIAGWFILGIGIGAAALGQLINAPHFVLVAYYVMQLVVQLFIAYVIMRELKNHPDMTVQSIFAASSLYVMIGIVFARFYAVIQAVTGEPFFAAARPIVASDFTYYSFVTLTTIGYGDVTAATEVGRIFSIIEAIIGSLYLVTVVALIVSNVRPAHKTSH